MKKLPLFFPVLVMLGALGTAFATAAQQEFMTTVWRKSDTQPCQSTTCVQNALLPCGEAGFTYHSDENCTSVAITPTRSN